jgi:hypothetical protein
MSFNIQEYRKKMAGQALLGNLIIWSVSEFKISYDELVARLKNSGLPEKLARPTSEKSAATKAVKAYAKSQNQDHFHRKLVDGKETTAFAIVSQAVDSSTLDVKYSAETKAVLDKGNKTLKVSGPGGKEIMDHFDSYRGSFTGEQVRNIIHNFLSSDCNAISVRGRGGNHFIPVQKSAEFEALEKFLQSFPEIEYLVYPVADSAAAKRSTWKALTGDIQAELAAAKKDIDSLAPDASDKVLQRRLDEYAQLKNKVLMFEEVLEGTAQELKDSLVELSKTIQNKMTGGIS